MKIQTRKRGQTLVEYGLIIVLLAAVLIGAMTLMKNAISNSFSKSASAIDSVTSEQINNPG